MTDAANTPRTAAGQQMVDRVNAHNRSHHPGWDEDAATRALVVRIENQAAHPDLLKIANEQWERGYAIGKAQAASPIPSGAAVTAASGVPSAPPAPDGLQAEAAAPTPAEPLDDCPCGHDENEHVHYCSAITDTGQSCHCVQEYVRLAAARPTPATGNASKRNPVPPRINVVADTPTPAEPLDVDRLAEAMNRAGVNPADAQRIAAEYNRLAAARPEAER